MAQFYTGARSFTTHIAVDPLWGLIYNCGVRVLQQHFPPKIWDFQRFGWTPWKIWARLTNAGLPSVFVTSIPKAGTHLVERALVLHPRLYRKMLPKVTDENLERLGGLEALLASLKPGEFLLAHLYHSPEREKILQRMGIPTVFVVRDPRDIVVSDTFFILRWKEHPLHDFFRQQKTLKDQLRLAILGYPPLNYPSIEEKLRRFSGWLQGNALVVRFEHLVGPQGGGDPETQVRTLRDLFEYLGISVSHALLESIARRMFFSKSPTFRKGAVRQWQNYLDEELQTLFYETAGSWLKVYGYDPAS